MGIIDKGLFYHLNDSVVHYEDELSLFIVKLLAHVKIKGDEEDAPYNNSGSSISSLKSSIKSWFAPTLVTSIWSDNLNIARAKNCV